MKIVLGKLFFIVLLTVFYIEPLLAGPGGNGPPQPLPPPPPGLPLDNGLALLMVAALSYGFYAVIKYKKRLS